ncbi:glutaredoxin-C9-like [Impatiens glandulifera]|uniref:glutaredoxin-C9-like n=1 Tax=Impatiens glandulifera TaxID=253017 RepID=UPI001FB17A5A|nr:glutaredoxin-C9-like [Impatiens glandulifera]
MSKSTIPMPKDNDVMKNMISQRAVAIVGIRGCFTVQFVLDLLHSFGASPATYDIDEEDEMNELDRLRKVINGAGEDKNIKLDQLPLIFIGERLFGGVDKVISSHARGELIPALKQAGAIWL